MTTQTHTLSSLLGPTVLHTAGPKITNWPYLSSEVRNLKNKGTFFSPTLKVEENKVGLEFPFSHSKVYFWYFIVYPKIKKKMKMMKSLFLQKLWLYMSNSCHFSQITWILYDFFIDTKHLHVCNQIGHYLICQNGHI